MANLVGSYSPNDVILTVNGLPISGFADGTMVDITHNTDASTMVEGADGSPAIAFKKGARGGVIKFTLLATSLANNYLSGLLLQQKTTGSAASLVQAGVRNMQGGEMVTMPRGAFQKEPDVSYGADVGNREWTLQGQIQVAFAGNEV